MIPIRAAALRAARVDASSDSDVPAGGKPAEVGITEPIASGGSPDTYAGFLRGKLPRVALTGLKSVPALASHLFPLQAYCVEQALLAGRYGLFLDTGLGKTGCMLEFVKHGALATNGYGLILAPLAVAAQIVREGIRFGYEIRQVREQADVGRGINVCNYDRLDKLEPRAFGAVACDESAIMKDFTGRTTRALIEAFRDTPFRMPATATPAPNDHMELGQQAEFVGVMPSNEMLMRWFVADQTQMGRYRLKGHAVESFWDWMASWSCMASNPADLGFDGAAWELPLLQIVRHQVQGSGDFRRPIDGLFAADVSATSLHAVKRATAEARAEAAAELVLGSSRPWCVWCDTDYEADALLRVIPEAREVRGSHTIERKEAGLLDFVDGRARVLITKPSVAGHGLNFQHCADVVFVGRSFSYESWYQAVRRFWRFGQTRPVTVHLIVAEGEDQIGRVIDRKANDHAGMQQAMALAMRRARSRSSSLRNAYHPTHIAELPAWISCAA